MKNYLADGCSATSERTAYRFARLRRFASARLLTSMAIPAALLFVGFPRAAAQPRPQAATTQSIDNGKRIFASQNCAKCHGSEGQGGTVGQVAAPRIGPSRLSLPMFTEFVRNPMQPMPPVSAQTVSDAELADVYAYLSSMRPAPQSEAAPAGDSANGKRLYVSDGCYECHDREGQGGAGTGPRLAPNPIAFAAFERQLRNPVNEMPPYTAKVVPAKDLADIYAFLLTIPKPPSPDSLAALR